MTSPEQSLDEWLTINCFRLPNGSHHRSGLRADQLAHLRAAMLEISAENETYRETHGWWWAYNAVKRAAVTA
jgi:hypothetical protein